MSALRDVDIWDKGKPEQRETMPGRVIGPWVVVNRGRHLKWGLFDRATGMRLAHAAPSLKSIQQLIAEIDAAGLELEVNSQKWDYADGPVWGDGKSYTSDSIRAVGEIVRPAVQSWNAA